MKKNHSLLLGVSILPALIIVPAMAETLNSIDTAMEVPEETTYDVGAISFTGVGRGENPSTYGIIDNYGTLNFNGTTISNNTGLYGVVDNMGNMTLTNASINGNNSYAGGFVYNEAPLTITNSSFTSNEALVVSPDNVLYGGGAIYNASGTEITIIGGNFTSNKAENAWGGAIATSGKLNVDGTTFDGNTAMWAGTIVDALDGNGGVSTIKNSIIKNSSAGDFGGVALFTRNLTSIMDNVEFISNHATGDAGDGAGALFVGSEAKAKINGSSFTNNTSASRGGAISTRTTEQNNTASGLTITNSTFTNNKAGVATDGTATTSAADYGFGGAIYTNVWHDAMGNDAAVISDSTFTSNSAVNGGAIYNDSVTGKVGLLNFTNLTFSGNTALTEGGAIYNKGEINLAGTNTFTGNQANSVANDIHNLGTVTVASGTTTIDGGITGNGTLVVENGATLNIGNANVDQGTISLDGTMLMTLRSGDAQITANTFDGDGTLNLAISGEGVYHVFGDAVFANAANSVYDLEWSGGDVTATMKSISDIAENAGITQETAAALASVSQSTSENLNDLAVKMQEKLAEDTPEAKQEIERVTKAIHPEKESVTQSVVTSVQTAVANLTGARMRMSAPRFGRNGGDAKLTAAGIWVQGLYNKTKMNDKFDSYTRGVATGIDGTINKFITFGAGYAFNHSDVSPDSRDIDINSNTAFLYGQFKPNDWYVNATLNYTFSDYDEKGNALGTPVTSDYSSHAFGAQLMTGYDFAGGITPELGLRYLHVNSADYTNSLGIKNKLDSADYLTAMLGTKYGFTFATNKYMLFRPDFHYAIKYDLISDKSSATVAMPGVTAYTINGDRLSRVAGELGIGLTMKVKELDISLNYDIELREHYTSQTGMLKARYNF